MSSKLIVSRLHARPVSANNQAAQEHQVTSFPVTEVKEAGGDGVVLCQRA